MRDDESSEHFSFHLTGKNRQEFFHLQGILHRQIINPKHFVNIYSFGVLQFKCINLRKFIQFFLPKKTKIPTVFEA